MAQPKDFDKFKAYLGSVKSQLDKNSYSTSEGVKNAYNEWKKTGSVLLKKPEKTQQEKDEEKKKNDLEQKRLDITSNKKDEIAKDETVTSTMGEQSNTNNIGTGVYGEGMEGSLNSVQAIGEKANEDINKNTIEEADRKKEVLDGIYGPALEKYSKNTNELLGRLDEVLEQNKISLEEQRRIANNLREAAGVESMIAQSKVGAGMSQTQLGALSKDISMGYKKAISEADGNFELARINTFERLKNLGITAKEAQDTLAGLGVTYGLAAAEPILAAITTSAKNKNDLITKVAGLKSGVKEASFEEDKQKFLTQEAYNKRELEWNNAKTDQEKMNIIVRSLPKGQDGNPLFYLDTENINNIIKGTKDWGSIYNNLGYLAGLKEQQRLLVYTAIAHGKTSLDKAIEKVKGLGEVSGSDINDIAETKGETKLNTENENRTNTTSVDKTADILKSGNNVAEYNKTNTDKIETTKQNEAIVAKDNAEYKNFISKLKPEQKQVLDKIVSGPKDKVKQAIEKINKDSSFDANESKQQQRRLIIKYLTDNSGYVDKPINNISTLKDTGPNLANLKKLIDSRYGVTSNIVGNKIVANVDGKYKEWILDKNGNPISS